MKRARPVYFPEEGTDVEQAAMAFHARGEHASHAGDGRGGLVQVEPGVDEGGDPVGRGAVAAVGHGEERGVALDDATESVGMELPAEVVGGNAVAHGRGRFRVSHEFQMRRQREP